MKNKLLLTILFSIFLIFAVFVIDSSAYTVTVDDHVYDFGDIKFDYFDNGYTFVYNNLSDHIVNIYSFDNEPKFKKSGDYYVIDSNSHLYRSYCYKKNGNVYSSDVLIKEGENYGVFYASNFISSTFDIKDQDGNVLFQRPVLTLAEVLEEAKPVETFQTMMSGIIVSLVVFLVGLVAFWKAWSFLSKNLRKA